MSQFDNPLETEYVENMRVFLRSPKYQFLVRYGFADIDRHQRGRLPAYKQEAIQRVEDDFNEKAAIADSRTSTIGQRIGLALSYINESKEESAARLKISKESLRRWLDDLSKPSHADKAELARALNVPQHWLETGDPSSLSADSQIGVRVGQQALECRQTLRAMTQPIIDELMAQTEDVSYIQTMLEWHLANNPEMAQIARKAGGRWQVVAPEYLTDESFVFAPWVPIKERVIKRRLWSDNVEEIIESELRAGKNHSIYEAYKQMEVRFMALNEPYPQRVSLYKRLEKDVDRAARFGVDINRIIQDAVKKTYGE